MPTGTSSGAWSRSLRRASWSPSRRPVISLTPPSMAAPRRWVTFVHLFILCCLPSLIILLQYQSKESRLQVYSCDVFSFFFLHDCLPLFTRLLNESLVFFLWFEELNWTDIPEVYMVSHVCLSCQGTHWRRACLMFVCNLRIWTVFTVTETFLEVYMVSHTCLPCQGSPWRRTCLICVCILRIWTVFTVTTGLDSF